MTDYQRIVATIASLAIIILVFELVRRRRLREEYSLLWLAAGIVMLVFSVHGSLVGTLARLLGIKHPAYTLFVLALLLGLVLAIHFTTVISKLTGQTWRLTQEIALLNEKVRELSENSPNEKKDAAKSN